MHQSALSAIAESGPITSIHSVLRLQIIDLCQWPLDVSRVSIASEPSSLKEAGLGSRKLWAWSRHRAQAVVLAQAALTTAEADAAEMAIARGSLLETRR